MSQCLRCSKLCEDTNVFCDDCRSLLQYQLQNRPSSHASQQESSSEASSFEDSPTLPEQDNVHRNPLEHITSPLPSSRVYPIPYPSELTIQADLAELAVSQLNEAAQRIEKEEEQVKSDHKAHLFSRASRLSPILDISSDIQRESTPLPQISITQQSEPTSQNGLEHQLSNSDASEYLDSASAVPDLWPWLDADTGDKDSDNWANQSDPLISRRFPNSDESARIEEEDIQRAMEQRLSFAPFAVSVIRRYSPRMRLAFIGVVIFALIAISVDGILLLRVALDHSPNKKIGAGPPTLILSSNKAGIGDKVQFTLEHFTPSTSVALTHDIHEPIQVNGNSSLITIGSTGSATAFFSINSDWGPGLHWIYAEDVTTRFTASANLIIGSGLSRPPHLSIDTRPLHLGADVVGANTISMFTLGNSGDGSISWSASSDKSWLLVSPSQGIFSQNQIISIAAQRVGLTPGNYSGTITISSNVSSPETIDVDMTVQPLPPDAGPVIALSPALLTFTTTDGNANSSKQSLNISNPGSLPLSWSVVSNSSPSAIPQASSTQTPGSNCHWLSTDTQLGTVQPGLTSSIQVIVNSQCLLPGAYIGVLQFNPIPIGASFDGPQSVNVSITVQPHCGIVTSSGTMSFNAVGGEGNLGNQTLNLSATASCAGSTLSWSAASTASWLTVTPSSGQLKGTAGVVVSVSVNAGNLPPGQIQGMISFIAGQSTQTVIVQLNVQPTPSPAAPIMGASPLSINFSNIQGQPNPAGQVVTITNNGGSSLRWSTTINQSSSNWLGAAPSGGVIAPGQTGQLMINVNTSPLTPGNYSGQIILNGYNSNGGSAPGSPQTINVNLTVQPPCSMSRSSSRSLSFNAVQGGTTPASQTVMFTGTGSCAWPVTWNATSASTANWLTLTPANGTIAGAGQSGSIGVAVNLAGLQPNTYTTKITISASDASGGTVQGSPETFIVKLTLQSSCILSQPASLSFTVTEGQTSSVQPVSLHETGTCAFPVSWTATAGAASSSWLVLSPPSGTDSGNGSNLGVSAKSVGMVPGKYNGRITISATDSAGTALSGSPQTINVSLTVTGFTVSGSVSACAAPAPCLPLPGARVRIMNGSKTVGAVTADASGNYSFSNIGVGSYTILVTGIDATHTHYVGSANVTVSGNTSVPPIQAIPG
jgi:hypothetical protein